MVLSQVPHYYVEVLTLIACIIGYLNSDLTENLSPGTPQLFLTPPEGEIEAEGMSSGAEADTEETEDPLQDKLNSPTEETEGYSVDPWPDIDQAIEEAFNQQHKD